AVLLLYPMFPTYPQRPERMVLDTGRTLLRSATVAAVAVALSTSALLLNQARAQVPAAPVQPQAPAASPSTPIPNTQQPPAQGPASVADLAEGVIDAVVNISTSQTIKGQDNDGGPVPMPKVPEGSPFQEFFDDYFGKKGDGRENNPAHKVQSLGSGFVIDAE